MLGARSRKSRDRLAEWRQDLDRRAANADGREMRGEDPAEKARRANSHLGTSSAAKSLGQFSPHGVGEFAHRPIPWPAPEVPTR